MRPPTPAAEAYLAEYGVPPNGSRERDNYLTFRLGFEAGRKLGQQEAYRQIAAYAQERGEP